MKHIHFIFMAVLLFAACSNPKKEAAPDATEEAAMKLVPADTFSVSTLIPRVECSNNEALSYGLYLPHQYKTDQHLPVLIFVDPHGDGAFPLYKYNSLAEKFGVILMGSNDSKNGLTFN